MQKMMRINPVVLRQTQHGRPVVTSVVIPELSRLCRWQRQRTLDVLTHRLLDTRESITHRVMQGVVEIEEPDETLR